MNKQPKVCKQCGKEFNSKYKDQPYCSRECQWESMRGKERPQTQKKVDCVCRHCGKGFKAYVDRTDFCSRECFQQHAKATKLNVKTRTCKECGKEHQRGYQFKYCSDECKSRSEARRKEAIRQAVEARRTEKEANRKTYQIECKLCGSTFESSQAGRKYCSDACARKYENQHRDKQRQGRYQQNGPADYSITLQKLYLKDGGKCYLCGEPVDMQAHFNSDYYGSIDHIHPISKGGTHTWDNVKLAHRKYNSEKSATLLEDLA